LVLLICVDGWIGGCWLRRLPLAEYQRQLLQVSSIPFGPHPWLVDVNIVDPSTICSGCRLDSVTRGCCPSHSIRYLLVPNTTAYHTILRILFHLPGLFLLSCVFGILSCALESHFHNLVHLLWALHSSAICISISFRTSSNHMHSLHHSLLFLWRIRRWNTSSITSSFSQLRCTSVKRSIRATGVFSLNKENRLLPTTESALHPHFVVCLRSTLTALGLFLPTVPPF